MKEDMEKQLRGYALKAQLHWKEHRPKMNAELEKNGQLYPVLKELGERVGNQVSTLIEKGFQVHEAEKFALPLILLPSEDDEPNLAESDLPDLSNLPPPVITASRKVIPLKGVAKRKQSREQKVR